MPPVNTPARTPSRPQTPSHQRPLTPLSYLSSPAPDLAATLQTHATDSTDDPNVNFLRDSLDLLDQDPPLPRRPQTHVDPQRDPRRAAIHDGDSTTRQPEALQTGPDMPEDVSRRARLQRVLARLNRLHEPAASSTAAYTNRTPSPNRQSLYDWAPGHEESGQDESELEVIVADLRRQQPEMHPNILRVLGQSQLEENWRRRDREARETIHAQDAHEVAERRERLRERERRRREHEPMSLRSRAALQRARQEGSRSPSATERMLRYVMERERSGMSEEEERARGAGWFRPTPDRSGNPESNSATPTRNSWLLPPPASELRERDRQERVEAFRRGYLAENVPPRLPRMSTQNAPAYTPSAQSPTLLEHAFQYLCRLRTCDGYDEALSAAIDHGLATKEFFADKHEDFIMDINDIPPLPYSSWLQPGAVFEGNQHATTNTTHLTHPRTRPNTHVVEQINPHFNTSDDSMTTGHTSGASRSSNLDGSRAWMSHQPSPPNYASTTKPTDGSHDRWPVRVIIHTIDPETMTLQGTMEAYDVPQHPSSLSILNSSERPKAGKKSAPITTYLEGHIIDLRTHSYLTPKPGSASKAGSPLTNSSATNLSSTITFPSANPHTDACNWRKLPPFNSLSSDDDFARLVLSVPRLTAVHRDYIFMRWKERCFVHSRHDPCDASAAEREGDRDRGHGLTISGFYYVSMRRSDGAIEGLYFDPSSTPYQHLRLQGCTSGWPAFQLR